MDFKSFLKKSETICCELQADEEDYNNEKTALVQKYTEIENLLAAQLNLFNLCAERKEHKAIEETVNIELIKLRQKHKKLEAKVEKQDEVVESLCQRLQKGISSKDLDIGSKRNIENFLVRRLTGLTIDTEAKESIAGALMTSTKPTAQLFNFPISTPLPEIKAGLLQLSINESSVDWAELFHV